MNVVSVGSIDAADVRKTDKLVFRIAFAMCGELIWLLRSDVVFGYWFRLRSLDAFRECIRIHAHTHIHPQASDAFCSQCRDRFKETINESFRATAFSRISYMQLKGNALPNRFLFLFAALYRHPCKCRDKFPKCVVRPTDRFQSTMKTANRSRDELRFVTSVEQIAPYLEELQSDTSSSAGDIYSMEQIDDVDSMPPAPPTIALPNIYEEYVNFIDLSVLNPIVAACDCQRDQLIESEISERSIYANKKKNGFSDVFSILVAFGMRSRIFRMQKSISPSVT